MKENEDEEYLFEWEGKTDSIKDAYYKLREVPHTYRNLIQEYKLVNDKKRKSSDSEGHVRKKRKLSEKSESDRENEIVAIFKSTLPDDPDRFHYNLKLADNSDKVVGSSDLSDWVTTKKLIEFYESHIFHYKKQKK